MADTFHKQLCINQPLIVNTDLSQFSGVHWIVMIPRSNGTMYMFDPLGPENEHVASDGSSTDSLIEASSGVRPFNPEQGHGGFKGGHALLHRYPYATQISTTGHCGWFCIYVAKLLHHAIQQCPNISNKKLDALIVENFGQTADWGDVKKLANSLQ